MKMRKWTRRILFIGGILLVIFCILVVVASISVFISNQKIKETQGLYDRGFALVMAGVPDKVSECKNKEEKALYIIKGFKKRIKWADWIAIGEDKARTNKAQFYLTVMPDHKLVAKSQEDIIQMRMHRKSNLNILTIKPVKISPEWAGLFLAHNLTHLIERSLKIIPIEPTNEEAIKADINAYWIQMLVADKFTAGRLKKAVLAIIKKKEYYDAEKIANFLLYSQSDREWVSSQLQAVISKEKPTSVEEKIEREMFYIVSVCFLAIDMGPYTEDGKQKRYFSILNRLNFSADVISEILEKQEKNI